MALPPFRCRRMGQVRASTLFGIALALLVALIVAAIFVKFVLPGWLEKKPTPVQNPPPLVPLTLAKVNILPNKVIQAVWIKTEMVTPERYKQLVKRGTDEKPGRKSEDVLTGNEPIGLTTKEEIRAER